MTKIFAVFVVVAGILVTYCFWPSSDPAPPHLTVSEPATHGLPSAAQERSAATAKLPQTRSPVSDNTQTNIQAEPTSREPTTDYAGRRDENLLHLYQVFSDSVKLLSKNMQVGTTSRDQDETYLEHLAYVSLIQDNRLHTFSYETLAGTRPPNTPDRVYHTTGYGGAHVVFELTRADFPQLFAIYDERRREEEAAKNRPPLGSLK